MIFLISIFVVGVYVYRWYVKDQYNKKVISDNQTELRIKELKIMKDDNEQYLAPIKDLCNKPVGELSGIDFHKCSLLSLFFKDPDSKSDVAAYVLHDAKGELESLNLPAYCIRKISTMTSNELIECNPAEDYIDNPFRMP